MELSKLQTSPPSTRSESLISVASDTSSSEISNTRAAIPDSMLQLPVKSDSSLKTKRGSFDSGYASPKKSNAGKIANKEQKTDDVQEAAKEGGNLINPLLYILM